MNLLQLLSPAIFLVLPGTSWQNLDGVAVQVAANSPAVELSPQWGWAGSKSSVDCPPNSVAWIEGLDQNDIAHVGAGARVSVVADDSGGCVVSLDAGCVAFISNPGTLVGVPWGPPIVIGSWVIVELPGGAQSGVAPGTSWTFRP